MGFLQGPCNRVAIEPNPPFGYQLNFSVAFGLYDWEESNARKIKPCTCGGIDRFDNPPTAAEMNIGEDGHQITSGDKKEPTPPKGKTAGDETDNK